MNHVHNTTEQRQQGFTLIELMLAMTFISMLLLAIALTTIQIMHIYDKGLTLKSVNQAGRDISSSLQRDIAASAPFNVNDPRDTAHYLPTTNGGRLCLGQYSYVWNYGSAISANRPADLIKYEGDNAPVRIARVLDPSSALCANTSSNPTVSRQGATELLAASDSLDLAIQQFGISMPPAVSGANAMQPLYNVSFTLGTNDQQSFSADKTCTPSGVAGSNWQFCATSVFNVVVHAGNEG
jgi:prepilin-type N-terminal cleavage/methylation domain-containing protein